MVRLTQILIFLAAMTCIIGGSHYYLWLRLLRDTQLTALAGYLATAALIVFGLAMPSMMLASRLLHQKPPQWALWTIYMWMAFFFLVFHALLFIDIASWLLSFMPAAWITSLQALLGNDATSVLLSLRRLAAIFAVAFASFGLVLGHFNILRGPYLEKVDVTLSKLPKSLQGFSIVQISDLHVSHLIGAPYVRKVVDLVNQQHADVVVLTGDLVDGSVPELFADIEPLKELQAKQGVYFVTGNHEYYSGADAWIEALKGLKIRTLRNEHILLGKDDQKFALLGVDDYTAHQFGLGHGASFEKALEGIPESYVKVLLAHQPRHVEEAASHAIDLMLSGHTHGGQIWPFGIWVRLVQPYLAGLHWHDQTQIYVNRGTGFWGPPVRLAAPAEITLLTLQTS